MGGAGDTMGDATLPSAAALPQPDSEVVSTPRAKSPLGKKTAASQRPDVVNVGVEIMHVWDVDGKQHVSISSALGGSPKQFGQLLAQIALYSAQIYEQNEKLERTDCLRQILTGFKEEVAKEVTRQG